MNFANVKDIVIPQGNVIKIHETNSGRVLWEKEQEEVEYDLDSLAFYINDKLQYVAGDYYTNTFSGKVSQNQNIFTGDIITFYYKPKNSKVNTATGHYSNEKLATDIQLKMVNYWFNFFSDNKHYYNCPWNLNIDWNYDGVKNYPPVIKLSSLTGSPFTFMGVNYSSITSIIQYAKNNGVYGSVCNVDRQEYPYVQVKALYALNSLSLEEYTFTYHILNFYTIAEW